MSKIKFPPLQKALTKNGELTVLSDYIYMHNYHAIIVNPKYVILIDLKARFNAQADDNATPDYDYENALDILEFLDGKLISGAYWEELVDAQAMKPEEDKDYIHITSKGTSKELFHIAPDIIEGDSVKVALENAIEEVKKYAKMEKFSADTCSFNLPHVILIANATKATNDTVVIENMGPGRHHRFTFEKHRDVFGVIADNRELNEEMFLNHFYEQWHDGLDNPDPFERVDWIIPKEAVDEETTADLFRIAQKQKKEAPMKVLKDMVDKGELEITSYKNGKVDKVIKKKEVEPPAEVKDIDVQFEDLTEEQHAENKASLGIKDEPETLL